MPEVRQRDGAVPMRGHRIGFAQKDTAYEIPVDFFSDIPMTEYLVWTNISDRLRVKIGAGSFVVIGATRATAADLGVFTAGQTKECTIEVKIPAAADTRHEELELNIGVGV